ncbi:rhodanese-like domain-containing protein [Nocardioides sp. SYSU D00038]|uniref:rhodanese-like domain-containing protein n=1 Tax=Nocardioides sp. SYSU D00038 TaxID=2812554 RepID=UPI001966EB97|nr:rhodanese-like domain-containing protein [Nocardioides sp. SYSU D00038]
MTTPIDAAELRRLIDEPDRELAILDLRPPLVRTQGHPALSGGIPLHDLEQRVTTLVPRRGTTVVLASEPDLDARGAEVLARLGYTDVRVLRDGLAGWSAAGERLYTGTNVRSKTLGEWIEAELGTRTVDSETVARWREAGEDVVVLDSRPHEEYVHHHIPGGLDTGGGAELAFRGLAAVTGPATRIVVNCAGRTRGIVGAQSLVNTGIVNPVYSLHNGTPAWGWAGLRVEDGPGTPLPAPVEVPDDLRKWAQQTLDSAGATVLDAVAYDALVADARRTTYVIDVRRPEEHAAGSVPGARSVQGGQLVQGTDEHLPVLGARVVLVDTEDLLRSASTVQWLRYLHDGPVHVITHDAPVTRRPETTPAARPEVPTVSAAELGAALASGRELTVVDLRPSREYAAGHLPGAVHARREHLAGLVGRGRLVLVGSASYAPHFAAADLLAAEADVAVLTDDLADVGVPLTTADPQHAGEVVDEVGPPEFGPERDRWYREYFEWEYSLVPASTGDPDFAFEEKRP